MSKPITSPKIREAFRSYLGKARRGFAAMSPAKRAMISSKGGKAAHIKGAAHQFTSDEARRAGRLGGEAVSRDRYHMAEIGAKGGTIRGNNARKRMAQEGQQDISEIRQEIAANATEKGIAADGMPEIRVTVPVVSPQGQP